MSYVSAEHSTSEVDFAEHLENLTQIGKALSAERNIDSLLEMIVDEGRSFTHADGGTLYIIDNEKKILQFAIIQNDSLHVRMGGTAGHITWPPVQLYSDSETPNYANVSSYAALSGEVVSISDVYHAEKFDFEGTRTFDAKTGYRSQSMLVVPMRNHENDIIGVLQLLNAQDASTGQVIPFSPECQHLTESLASQAAVALTNNTLIKELENLFESFIKTIAMAIDEKSPYTGNHGRHVVDLTMLIARAVDRSQEGYFRDVHLDKDQMNEIRIAAWLHDVGKVAIPEHVLDKATRLESISDGNGLLRTRSEVIKRDIEKKYARSGKIDHAIPPAGAAADGYEKEMAALMEDIAFLEYVNKEAAFLSDEDVARVESIATRKWSVDGKEMNFLTDGEIECLTVRRGTLTDRERDIINSHTTIAQKMLSQISFPKRLKNVPFFAASHHERLNGEGYPNGLKGDEIPLQARIIAFADVFEALTASDRPYRKANTLSHAIKILGLMVKDRHLDEHLFELFMKEKLHLEYAKRELDPEQIDEDI